MPNGNVAKYVGGCPRHCKKLEILAFKLSQGLTHPHKEYKEDIGNILMMKHLPKSVSCIELSSNQEKLYDLVESHPQNWRQTRDIAYQDIQSDEESSSGSDAESVQSWHSCQTSTAINPT